MLKRPLAVICIIVIIFLSVLQTVRRSDEDRLLLQTEQILMEYAEASGHVTVFGTVNTCSRLSSGIRLYLNHITVSPTEESEFSLLPDTQIILTTEDETVFPGDCILAYGKCSFWEEASNPGTFDARNYYFSNNIACLLDHAEIIRRVPGKDGIKRNLCMIKRRLEDSFYKILDDKAAGTITAICLGEKGGMDAEWKETFQDGGIAHILAVSGLHITLIGTGLYQILRKTGCSFLLASLISGTSVFLYAGMTGFSVSAVRAAMMFLVWLGAQIFGRKYDMLTAVSAAAIILLIKDSSIIQEASFLLSYSAVLVLAVLVPAVQNSCMLKKSVIKHVSSGILIWIGTLPVTLYFFYQTAPWSFFLNLIVVPLMALIMVSGLGAAVTGCLHISAGIFLGAPVHYLLYFFEWFCRLEKKLPLAIWITGRPQKWKICLFYMILPGCVFLFNWMIRKNPKNKRKIYKIRIGWGICLLVCIGLMCPKAESELRITCMDVGQGDGTVLQMPTGEVFLVDGGSTSERHVWKYQIEKSLKYFGISQIDGIFLSHADKDHINGVEEYLDQYTPGINGKNIQGISLKRLYLPPANQEDAFVFAALREKAIQAGIEVLTVSKGSKIESKQGEWSIHCLSPDSDTVIGNSNENSMVLMVKYRTFQMLFTGDLEGETEKELARNPEELNADILKVGHHGSSNGSSEEFLQAVTPELSIISCGENNQYGHPADETLERLKTAGSRILVTADCGAIQIISDGEQILQIATVQP